MAHPRDWSSTTNFLISSVLGALGAYAALASLEIPRWAQISIVVLLPVWIGLLAAAVRENIFFWLAP